MRKLLRSEASQVSLLHEARQHLKSPPYGAIEIWLFIIIIIIIIKEYYLSAV